MFHYVNAITNTRGDALTGFFVRAIDTASGSTVSIFADQNSTPIQAVSGVANAAQVDSDGNASFYVDSGEYHLDIYATDSTTFVKRIENIPMVSEGDFVINADLAASTGAALVGATGGGTVQDGLDRIGTFAGYDSGGGSVAQTTSKSTAVTLNKPCGQITTSNAALAGGASVSFTLNNSFIAATDTVVANVQFASGGRGVGEYAVRVGNQAAGRCLFVIENKTAGTLGDAIIINFAIVSSVNA
jgi:hypothetical protein